MAERPALRASSRAMPFRGSRSRAGVGLAALAMVGCAASPATSVAPAAAPSTTTAPTDAAKHGVHGMVLFGRAGLWASHLPMYEAPHDAQVVLALGFADPTVAASYRAELGDAPLVTFVPEPFDLLALAPGGVGVPRLRGAIYRGHFERDGVLWKDAVDFEARVVWYRAIDGSPQDPAAAVAFGAGDETYLMHLVGARPGVDRIVAVEGPAPASSIESVVISDAVLSAHGWRNAAVIYEERADRQ
jgi:hypothetical protein